MKVKLILLLITTLCITSITPVCAEPTYDKEILFNNIPWGSSLVQVEDTIPGIWIYLDDDEQFTESAYSCAGLGTLDEYDFARGTGMTASFLNYNKPVGGYDVEYMHTYYAYTFPNNEINREHKNTSLYGADYELNFVDVNNAFDDLAGKLCSLYGNEYITKEITTLFDGLWTTYTWEGINSTYVSLSKYVPTSGLSVDNPQLKIQYARLDGDELLKRNIEIVNNAKIQGEESIYGNGNNSGL